MMKNAPHSKYIYWLMGIIALLLFLYSAIRSATVCFTIDEAFTFQRYVKNSNFFPQEYDMHTANFHMLNTWMMIICAKLFGIAEWSLRLPSVLAHGVFLFFTAKYAAKSRQGWSVVAIFILLNVHPYMLDFFSLARGYGLQLAFVAGSLWYVGEFFTKGKQLKHLILTLTFAGLGMWANFGGLLIFTAVVLVVFFGIIFAKEYAARRKILGVALLGLAALPFAAVAFYVLVQLQEVNAFFWGSEGFWQETVCVLGAKLAYPVDGNIYSIPHADTTVMLFVLLVPAAFVLYSAFRNRRSPMGTELLILLAIFGCVLLQAVVQHLVLQSPYPGGRTALFLFLIFLWIVAAAIRDTMLPRYVSMTVCLSAASFLLWIALPVLNVSYTSEWRNCENVKQALNDLMHLDYKPDAAHPGITLSTDTEFGNIIAYYLRLEKIENVSIAGCQIGQSEPADYYILSRMAAHEIPSCDTLRDYSNSGLLLLRNRTLPPLQPQQGTTELAGSLTILKEHDQPGLLCTHTLVATDSGFGRLNFSATVKFPQPAASGLFLIWHYRDGKSIWNTYAACDAPVDSLVTTVTVSRPFPLKVRTGDIIRVFLTPYQDPGGPIEISDVTSTFWVEKQPVAE